SGGTAGGEAGPVSQRLAAAALAVPGSTDRAACRRRAGLVRSSVPYRCLGDVVENPAELSTGHHRLAIVAHPGFVDGKRCAAIGAQGDLGALAGLGARGTAPDEGPVLVQGLRTAC